MVSQEPSAASEAPVTDVPDLEARLVERARAGDAAAWSRLYQRHFDSVFRHVRYLTGSTDLAEDLTQEAFAHALVSLSRFRGEASFSTWLHKIALNVVRKHWRWRRNTDAAHERLARANELRARPVGDPDGHTVRKARAAALYAILDAMPDHLREVFVLRDLEGVPQAEIAARLEISDGNAAVRATRARAHVRRELERLGWLGPEEATS
jgi:RNA polymerase sigma-70 factor (ECF subfamily)